MFGQLQNMCANEADHRMDLLEGTSWRASILINVICVIS